MKPINPDVSHDYKYTSDYREIPIEYLNTRMPKGRVIFKWQAFKTMPEQYEQLEQYIQNQSMIEKLILDDDQLNELNNTLIFKMCKHTTIELRYFDNKYIKTKVSYI